MTVLLTLLALAVVAMAAKATLFSSQRVRRMRWRIMVRLRPGPGFATLAELTVRWSRLAALHHGRRARPSMRLHHRITARTTEYAIRLGRAQYGRRVFARAEDQTLILSLPRSGKVRDAGGPGDRPSRRGAGHRIAPRHLHRHRRVPRPARPDRGVQPRERLRHPVHLPVGHDDRLRGPGRGDPPRRRPRRRRRQHRGDGLVGGEVRRRAGRRACTPRRCSAATWATCGPGPTATAPAPSTTPAPIPPRPWSCSARSPSWTGPARPPTRSG